ncbi:transcriptional corepressor LEUNIG_HOMOLOG-like [Salvia hispanica]|uniref:transcriptional corepressor LEUNIG_HOMOLOG-like n=1 Tax=Salvia hispanica TaxID=49212 RepID=UPI0020097E8F|nr:transcriptional corepressor LEUNIG_HOMOLOG-like [Salvia hispanica]
MDDWDAQKMLDLYIYDYLQRKKLHMTADILADEADIQPKSVVITPPEGFLSEWWSLFWDVFISRVPQGDQASTSETPLNDVSVLPNAPGSPVPDVSYMMQNVSLTTPRSGLPNQTQAVNPPPMPNMGSLLQNAFPSMMPNMDFTSNQFGQTPLSFPENTMRQEQIMADLVAQRAREQEHLRLPPRSLDTNSHVLNVDHLASMLPLASSSSRRQKKVSNKRQIPVINDVNYGTGLRRSIPPELTPYAPKLVQDDIGHADAGRKILEDVSLQGQSSQVFGYAANTPVSDQQRKNSSTTEICQKSSSDLEAQASKKLIISEPENSNMMTNPALSNDGSKGKGIQIEMTESEGPVDEEIASFFSNDEAANNMNISSTHTSAKKQKDQQDFPFMPIRSLHPSNNKLLCCDFSTQGKFLATAGHEKKVFIWNLKQSTRHAVQGHTQLITDIRFKPNSHMFATSSFDKIVKIWDAANSRKILYNLVGHADQVMSVDFHPRKSNLVCSCDCSDEIRLWNFKESACFRFFKGANRQVRFQPRQGNLLAAATGNVINMIDVETGMIRYRFEGHEKDVRTICWDVCGEYLVSTSQDSTRIWSIVSGGKCIHELPACGREFSSCTFHPAYSQVVAVGSYESIYIWNPTMGNKTWKFDGHQGIVSAMANAPETNMIASVSHDQWVKVWK